ncbi:TolC family protein [Sphingomonas sp. JC676]|uniref:TolC family protein n=1 Tax=Sphingomonas sp. JC676 TaxID=2768065 RepID=UPI001657EC3C|nr:TolC family protein [Sphingomonas sp. JC676]MBC9032646.1 TolC family protein [Sphingomonas sp. JC676]
MPGPSLSSRAWLTGALLLAGCARSSLDLAPPSPSQPWVPATSAIGEIVPGKASASAAPSPQGYVLPANPALAVLPAPSIDPHHAYTLAELIDIAELNNPSTRIAWNEARNAALAAGIAKSTYLPRITTSAVGGYQTQDQRSNLAGIDGDRDADGVIAAVSLQWLLFDFGGREAAVAAARQDSVISNIVFTAAHQKLIHDVSLAYYTHAAARAHVAAAEQSLENAKAVQASAEDRYRRGVGTVIEVNQTLQVTAQARLALVTARSAAQNSGVTLLAAMGVSPLIPVQIAEPEHRQLSPAMAGEIEKIVTDALARRPDMLAAYAAQKRSAANVRAARSAFMPKIFVATTGSYATGDIDVSALPGTGGESPTFNLSSRRASATILAGVTIPLFDGGRRDALLRQARNNQEAADSSFARTSQDAVREIVIANNQLANSLAAVDASTALVAAAQTNYDAALDAYRSGVGPITPVLEAQTQLLAAKTASIDAYSQALSSAATLALATGSLGSAP